MFLVDFGFAHSLKNPVFHTISDDAACYVTYRPPEMVYIYIIYLYYLFIYFL
jgi:hypothetical protein